MARYRQSETRWVQAAFVAGGYLVCVASLFALQVGAGLSVPLSVAVATPPLVYAALAVLLLRESPFVRRLSWVGAACVVHGLLGVLAATELAWAGGLSLVAALAQVFVLFPPAPVLTLVATPLALAAFGLTASKPTSRVEPAPPRQAPPVRSRPISPPPRAARSAPDATVPTTATTPPVTPQPASAVASPAPATRPPASVAAASVVTVAAAPAPAPAASSTPPSTNRPQKASRTGDDGMVRVPFARIATQLPAEAFVLPFERLGESLREPHVVLVPRRVVLSQLREDGVAITWAHIASQFPELALGMSDDEFRRKYPDLKLVLPMEDLASQLPPGLIPPALSTPPDRIEAAPVMSPPPAPVVSAPPAVPAPPPPAPTFFPPPAHPIGPPRAELVDHGSLSRIVACFDGVGSFEAAGERLTGSTVVALIEPGLPREAAMACAGRLLPFMGASGEVVTVRTERAVLILAAATLPVVVAARASGAPVALLALRAAQAVAAGGNGAARVPSRPPRELETVAVAGGATEAARALRCFGVVEPTAFADGRARVHVFSAGGDDKALGALALGVCDAVGDGGDLGRLRAVVFRGAGEHTLVRPLAGVAGVLAARGPVTRAGRILPDADRAATALEAI